MSNRPAKQDRRRAGRVARRTPSSANTAPPAARIAPAPKPGWNTAVLQFVNPRHPAVTRSLAPDLNLERYFAAGALIGLLASQIEEPDQEWAAQWALQIGEKMAKHARKRRS